MFPSHDPEGDSPLDIIGGNDTLTPEELIEKAQEIEELLKDAKGQVKQELEAEMRKILAMLPDQLDDVNDDTDVDEETEDEASDLLDENEEETKVDPLTNTVTAIIKNRPLHTPFNNLIEDFYNDHFDTWEEDDQDAYADIMDQIIDMRIGSTGENVENIVRRLKLLDEISGLPGVEDLVNAINNLSDTDSGKPDLDRCYDVNIK